MSSEPMLEINNLSIVFGKDVNAAYAIKDFSLSLSRGETVGVVGESGSGKSITSLAIIGLLPKAAEVSAGEIIFHSGGKTYNLIRLPPRESRALRGKKIAMIFQEPMTSLNPVHTCGDQVAESLKLHEQLSSRSAKARVLELFEDVQLPRAAHLFDSYPHQLSGGQKQRVMIAMALSCNPELIIADEPTTALDVTVQMRILQILKELCEKRQTGLIFITHDLGVVAEVASRVVVMYRGEKLEDGLVKDIFSNAQHPYTRALVSCRPRLDSNPQRLKVVSDFLEEKDGPSVIEKEQTKRLTSMAGDLLLELKDLTVWYPAEKNWLGKPVAYVRAVDNVSLSLFKGETLGLVGESGCGKTTLGRAILKLVPVHSGEIWYKGKNIVPLSQKQFKPYRKSVQLIFQDPYASLNPRIAVGDALLEPMKVHGVLGTDKGRRAYILNLIDKVGLPEASLKKYPHEFSGGQRQRICIARALAIAPEFIVCDESVSALDVSVQAQVLNLLNDLKEEFGLTYIFISHDLSVVKYMSDRLVVMRQGKIEEMGEAKMVYENPQSEYTKELIGAIPGIN